MVWLYYYSRVLCYLLMIKDRICHPIHPQHVPIIHPTTARGNEITNAPIGTNPPKISVAVKSAMAFVNAPFFSAIFLFVVKKPINMGIIKSVGITTNNDGKYE